MSASLVGSEMCIRDSGVNHETIVSSHAKPSTGSGARVADNSRNSWPTSSCLLYTSDAADDM
eukprot:6670660-Alexandrium_andersonii.AAC.1